jgi:hypothetical protein
LLVGAAQDAKVPKILEAEQFILRDSTGVTRLELFVRPDKSAGIALNDDHGKKRMGISIAPDGTSGIGLYDEQDESRLTLRLDEAGQPGLVLFGKQQENTVALDVVDDQGSSFTIVSNKGKRKVLLQALNTGYSGLLLRNGQQTGSASIAVDPDGTQRILLAEHPVKPRFGVTSGLDGRTVIDIFDKNQVQRLALGMTDDAGSALVMSDPTGRPLVQVGIAPPGLANLSLNSRKKNDRVLLGIQPDDTGFITIIDGQHKPLFAAPEAK